jgi:threonine/homoserine efflux transporter RhtA
MNITKKTLLNSIWFAAEVIGIFVLIQLIRIVIGNLDAVYSGLIMVIIAGILFLAAYMVAKNKDNNHSKNQSSKTFSGTFS